MPRLVFHLLLALTLVLNGLLAPWAMASMGDAAGSMHGMHHRQHQAAGAEPSDAAHHRHHGAHQDALQADHGMPDGDMDGGRDCCQGTACHCGCVLPPVLPLSIAFVLPQGVDVSPSSAVEPLSGIRRASPPLRPPAA